MLPALSPRGGDCGKILMPLTTPLAAAAAAADDDDGAQPAATGAGTSSRDFLLSRSRRVSEGFAKNVSLGRREKILRRQSTSAEILASIYHRFLACTVRRIVPTLKMFCYLQIIIAKIDIEQVHMKSNSKF